MNYSLKCPSCKLSDRIFNIQRVNAQHRYKVGYCPVEGDFTYEEISVTAISYEENEFACGACGWRCPTEVAIEQMVVPT